MVGKDHNEKKTKGGEPVERVCSHFPVGGFPGGLGS